MNTKFSYMYRDGGNYKTFYDFVFEGETSKAQLQRFEEVCLDEYFIPRALGLSGGVFPSEDGYDAELDHYWCEHDFEDSFELVNNKPDVVYVDGKPAVVQINAFLDAFEKCCEQGWETALSQPVSLLSVALMPDNSISVEEMKDAGYNGDGMLPMREEAAVELWNKDCAVYRLYDDDSESMVMDIHEFREHAETGGIFGVEKVDWLYFLERERIGQKITTTDKQKSPLEKQIQIAEKEVVTNDDIVQVNLTKDELNLIKQSLNEMGDRLADREGYSSGEKCWDLKEKLECLEKERSQGVER